MGNCARDAAVCRGDNERLRDEKAIGQRLAEVDEELEEGFEVQSGAVIPMSFPLIG